MLLVGKAWHELDTERPSRNAGAFVYLGPIPYRAVVAWASANGLDDEARDLVVQTLALLDADRMERIHADIASKTPPPGGRR